MPCDHVEEPLRYVRAVEVVPFLETQLEAVVGRQLTGWRRLLAFDRAAFARLGSAQCRG